MLKGDGSALTLCRLTLAENSLAVLFRVIRAALSTAPARVKLQRFYRGFVRPVSSRAVRFTRHFRLCLRRLRELSSRCWLGSLMCGHSSLLGPSSGHMFPVGSQSLAYFSLHFLRFKSICECYRQSLLYIFYIYRIYYLCIKALLIRINRKRKTNEPLSKKPS